MKKALIMLLAIMHEGKLYYCCEPTSKTGRAGGLTAQGRDGETDSA